MPTPESRLWLHRYHKVKESPEHAAQVVRGYAGDVKVLVRHVRACTTLEPPWVGLDVALAMPDTPRNRRRLGAIPRRITMDDLNRLEMQGVPDVE